MTMTTTEGTMETIYTTDGRAVRYPFTTEDFKCPRCRRLVRQGAQVVDVDGDVYCDLDCARVTFAPREANKED